MAYTTFWKRLSPTQLNIAIQAFSLIAIFFEGYDQGVMGGVNASPDYVREVGIGNDAGVITNTTKQGGIVSVVSLPLDGTCEKWSLIDTAVLPWCYLWMFYRRMGCRSYRSHQWSFLRCHLFSSRRRVASRNTKLKLYLGSTRSDWPWNRRCV